jgi:hypothetical protein
VRPPTNGRLNRARSLALAGVAVCGIAEVLTWFIAGSIWWSFRGFLRGGPESEAGIRDASLALVMFAVATANAAVLVLFLVRRRRIAAIALGVFQALDIAAGIALALLVDGTWIVNAVVAFPAIALILAYQRTATLTSITRSPS